MDKQLVISRERSNNRKTIHAYYNQMSYTWIAYGRSAYFLKLTLKERNQDCFRGYSKDYGMPYVVVDDKILRKLYSENGERITFFDTEVTFEVTKDLDFVQIKTFFDVDVVDPKVISILKTWKRQSLRKENK